MTSTHRAVLIGGVLLSLLSAGASSMPSSGRSTKAGKVIFDESCATCHETDSMVRKVGPGLKGYFSTHRPRPTDQGVRQLIEKGAGTMPPFPNFDSHQMQELIDYLRTL